MAKDSVDVVFAGLHTHSKEVRCTQVGDLGMGKFIKGLEAHPSIQELHLSGCQIGVSGMKLLAQVCFFLFLSFSLCLSLSSLYRLMF